MATSTFAHRLIALRTLPLCLVLVGLAACSRAAPASSGGESGSPASIKAAAPESMPGLGGYGASDARTGASSGTAPAASAAARAMRITVDTSVVVHHRDVAVASLRTAVASFGGYVSDGTVSGGDTNGSATFTVKVPASTLTDFRGTVKGFGEVRSDSEKAEDVTEARADTKARLHNARVQEARLLELLTTQTGKLADVVLVEKELSTVRETIERLEAQDRTLEGQIAFATFNIRFETAYVAVSQRPGHQLTAAAREGLETARAFVLGSVTLALAAGPTTTLLAAMLYLAFRSARAWSRRRTRIAEAA